MVLLAIPTGVIDWRIAETWSWPASATLVWFGLTAALLLLATVQPRWREAVAALTAASLYAVPVLGAVLRWHFVPSPRALIGDGAMQTQLAGQFLLQGTDPYGADYGSAGLASAPWGEPFPSPALHHLVVWPGQFLLPLPFQAAGRLLLGWWDERFFLLLAGVVIWLGLRSLFPGTPGRMAALAFFLIPGHSLLAVLGDNDLVIVALLLGALLAADRRRYLLMGALVGLAIATKQHALLAVPLILAWAAVRGARPILLLRAGALAMAVVAVIVAPFIAWNPHAFFQDTIVFLTGGGTNAYPINGFGLSAFLLSTGVIHSSRDAFPFPPLEAAIGIGLWLLGWRWLVRHRRIGDVLVWSGLVILAVFYVSRYFHDTHLLLGAEVILAGLIGRQLAAA